GAEEQTTRTQHVVAIGIISVFRDALIENVRGQRGVLWPRAKRGEHRRVHGALRDPQLKPVRPETIVILTAVAPPATRAAVLARRVRVEFQERPAIRAAAASARQQRLVIRKPDLDADQ